MPRSIPPNHPRGESRLYRLSAGASLQTILEENLNSESQGSTETITETTTELLPLPPFRGGAIFNVSVDSPPRNGKTEEERAAHENQNVNHAQLRANDLPL